MIEKVLTYIFGDVRLFMAIAGTLIVGVSIGIGVGSNVGRNDVAKRKKTPEEIAAEEQAALEEGVEETPPVEDVTPPVEDEGGPVDEGALEECLERLRKVEGKVERLERWVDWAREALAKTGKYLPLKIPPPPP